jgi:hypothetical protein
VCNSTNNDEFTCTKVQLLTHLAEPGLGGDRNTQTHCRENTRKKKTRIGYETYLERNFWFNRNINKKNTLRISFGKKKEKNKKKLIDKIFRSFSRKHDKSILANF